MRNEFALTLTLSRLTGEGTAIAVERNFQCRRKLRQLDFNSPSPIGWEGAGVMASRFSELETC